MSNKHQEFKEQLVAAVLEAEGATARSLRKSIEASASAGREQPELADRGIPAALMHYLQKVNLHAYKITDGDVQALRDQGYSEDAIFEVTVCAAVGAGLGRLERGLALLGSRHSRPMEGRHEVG